MIWWTRYWHTTITRGFGIYLVRGRIGEYRIELHLVLGAHHFMLAHRGPTAWPDGTGHESRWSRPTSIASGHGPARYQILAEGTEVRRGTDARGVAAQWLKSIFLEGRLHTLALSVMREVEYDDWSDVTFFDGPQTARIWIEAVELFREEGMAGIAQPHRHRENELRLWLGRAVAGKVACEPDRALAVARWTLDRLRMRDGGHPDTAHAEWEALIDAGPEAVMATLTSPAPDGIRLRANWPFRRILSRRERAMVVHAFSEYWTMRAPS